MSIVLGKHPRGVSTGAPPRDKYVARVERVTLSISLAEVV